MSKKTKRGTWQPAFLAGLGQGRSVTDAAEAAGVHRTTPHGRRQSDADFRRAWDAALGAARREAEADKLPARSPHWRRAFLEALAETSNVTAAAAQAQVPPRTVYKEKREDAALAAKWLEALPEGYDHLEVELLGYLRDPQPTRKMDVAGALRLLAAHRDTVERRRAMMEEEDEQAVLDSIDAFLEGMRQRRLANEALERDANAADVAR